MPLLRLPHAHGTADIGMERQLVLRDKEPLQGTQIRGDRIGIDLQTIHSGNVVTETRRVERSIRSLAFIDRESAITMPSESAPHSVASICRYAGTFLIAHYGLQGYLFARARTQSRSIFE